MVINQNYKIRYENLVDNVFGYAVWQVFKTNSTNWTDGYETVFGIVSGITGRNPNGKGKT